MTPGSEDRCSIQLSYTCAKSWRIVIHYKENSSFCFLVSIDLKLIDKVTKPDISQIMENPQTNPDSHELPWEAAREAAGRRVEEAGQIAAASGLNLHADVRPEDGYCFFQFDLAFAGDINGSWERESETKRAILEALGCDFSKFGREFPFTGIVKIGTNNGCDRQGRPRIRINWRGDMGGGYINFREVLAHTPIEVIKYPHQEIPEGTEGISARHYRTCVQGSNKIVPGYKAFVIARVPGDEGEMFATPLLPMDARMEFITAGGASAVDTSEPNVFQVHEMRGDAAVIDRSFTDMAGDFQTEMGRPTAGFGFSKPRVHQEIGRVMRPPRMN